MKLFVNVGSGMPVSDDDLTWIESHGLAGIRQDIHWDLTIARTCVEQFSPARTDLVPLFLLSADLSRKEIVDVALEVARWCVELGIVDKNPLLEFINEPNYRSKAPWRNRWAKDPVGLGIASAEAAEEVRKIDRRFRCMPGGIGKAAENEGLKYLEEVMQGVGPVSVSVAYHSYRFDNELYDEDPALRDREFTRMKAAAGGRALVCSESGWYRGDVYRRNWLGCKRFLFNASDEYVAWQLEGEIRLSYARGVTDFVIYELHDGPSTLDPNDNFGLIKRDGTESILAGRLAALAEEVAAPGDFPPT